MEKILYKLSNYCKTLNTENPSFIKKIYSNFIRNITLKLALYVRSKKINELDKNSISRYFNMYGTEATMSNFHLTAETLIEVLGFNINNIDMHKFKKFKGK
jgi:hypothetical protein